MMNSTALRELDRTFAGWVAERLVDDPEMRPLAFAVAAAVSVSLDLKHTCLDLGRVGALREPVLDSLLKDITPGAITALPETACSEAIGQSPLVRSADGQRVWLQKYALFEQRLKQAIRQRAAVELPLSARAQDGLATLYPEGEAGPGADQRHAIVTALTRQLAVITGGPGTGKTWTVARILALLLDSDPSLTIGLAAPTGKAANRMMTSLARALREDPALGQLVDAGDDGLAGALPAEARTLHSLLAIYRDSPKPRRNAQNPLPFDVLIVDEASMVDLPMMTRLLDALTPSARLVLLGDRDQLASVEAGGVLAELCAQGEGSIYAGLNAPVAVLETNHRSLQAINELAYAVNRGEALVPGLLDNTAVSTVTTGTGEWRSTARAHFDALAGEIAASRVSVAELLERLEQFQLLCALRQGPFGVAGINAELERIYGGRFEQATGRAAWHEHQAWYPGLPVMVVANDHGRRLYNGDVGLVLPVREGSAGQWVLDAEVGELRACFAGPEPRAIRFAQMPGFEPAYAVTVHKSQGSEYRQVVLVLPDDPAQVADHPVLTRELLYTGITRAAESLLIDAGEGVLQAMAGRRTVRMTGLG